MKSILTQLKELFLKFVTNFKPLYVLVFLFVFFASTVLCMYAVIIEGGAVLSEKIEVSADIEGGIPYKVLRKTPRDKYFFATTVQDSDNFLVEGYSKSIVLITSEPINETINQLNLKFKHENFSYDKTAFNNQWKPLSQDEIKDINKNLNGTFTTGYVSPKKLSINKTMLPYPLLKSIINYPGELEIIGSYFPGILFVTILFSFAAYLFYLLVVKEGLFTKIASFKKDYSNMILNVFLAVFLMIAVLYCIFPISNKILLYYLILLPILIPYIKSLFDASGVKGEGKFRLFTLSNAVLFIIIVAGFLLRIIGYDWGKPEMLHGDEWAIADRAYMMLDMNTIDPTFYKRPNHISIILSSIVYDFVSYIKFQASAVDTFLANKFFFYSVSRIICALLGTVAVYVGYLIGKEFNRLTGVFFAVLIAFFTPFTESSHTATPDMPLTLFVMATILFSIKYIKDQKRHNQWFMTLFATLAVIEKLPALILMFYVFIIYIVVNYKSEKLIENILRMLLTIFVQTLIISPFIIIRIFSLIIGYIDESQPLPGEISYSYMSCLLFYAKTYFSNTGIVMLLFSIIGMVFIIADKKLFYLPVFSGFVIYLLLSAVGNQLTKWGLPMFITPLFLAAFGMSSLFYMVKNKKAFYKIPVYIVVSVVMLSAFSKLFFQSSCATLLNLAKTTKTVSKEVLINMGVNKHNTLFDGRNSINEVGCNVMSFITKYRNENYMKTVDFIVVSQYDIVRNDKSVYTEQFYSEIMGVYDEIFTKKELLWQISPSVESINLTNYEFIDVFGYANIFFKYISNIDEIIAGSEIKVYR